MCRGSCWFVWILSSKYVQHVRTDFCRCPVALLHYYRQLRENLLEQWASAGCVSEEHCWETVALAVQADKGDRMHNEDDSSGFFRPEEYFPLWVINQYGLPYVLRNMPTVHNDLRGLDPTEAMIRFCREASKQPFALNCHLYGLRRHKLDVVDNALFGIATRGTIITSYHVWVAWNIYYIQFIYFYLEQKHCIG